MSVITLQSPVTVLYGVSESRAKLLEKLDIFTVDDLVRHYPRGYENRGMVKNVCELSPGEVSSCILEISSPVKSTRISSKAGRAMTVQKVTAHDETGSVALTFFNQEFLKNTLVTGRKFRFYGMVSGSFLNPQMTSPAYEPYYPGAELDDLVPVYPLTAGITCKMLSKLVKQALEYYKNIESLPKDIISEYGLMGLYDALSNIHFPDDAEKMKDARRRLAFEELLEFQLKLRALKNRNATGRAYKFSVPDMNEFYGSLEYELTGAQKATIDSILYDMTRCGEGVPCDLSRFTQPMRRLVQGDVGSGKTIVAAAAVYLCCKNGAQASLMVPTEILAEQHYASLLPLMEQHRIATALLTGSTKAAEKKKILEALRDGKIDFIIGTHALIEDKVVFANPGLAITDEQHRFGVRQRDKLSGKTALAEDGKSVLPHMLVMSATPIPRTLAMILYGDLDISIIDELPPGRQKVDTFAVGESMRERIYKFTEKLVGEGRQAYIVCPLAQETETSDEAYENGLKSAAEYCEQLKREVFPDLSLDFVHGKMKPAEKDKIMKKFSEGNTDILVSTTVIEVGVNVPNAALMVVENAERFGLSQLHQLRGRVGRGSHKSYCVLMSPVIKGQQAKGDSPSEKRFRIMCENSSGFKIAEYDLELRGPGDFFGRRQHGELEFKIADLAADMKLVEDTKKLADIITKNKQKEKSK
ncbi:MAG: ATP-dependent DNA helicase RecG [Clostridia bacterium]|nr:ATP-dependent DNA helicase RecG [Clostridia bacterium]